MKRRKLIMSLFIAGLMILSTFGVIFYGFANPSQKLIYNGISFKQTYNGYEATIDQKKMTFQSYPEQLEHINVSSQAVSLLSSARMVYLTYDPNASVVRDIAGAQFTLARDLEAKGIYSVAGMTQPNQWKLPVVSCSNATAFVPVLDFREGDQGVVADGSCIIVSGTIGGFDEVRERLLYSLYGVMP